MKEILYNDYKVIGILRNGIEKYLYLHKTMSNTSFTQIKNSVFSRTLADCYLVSSLLKEMYNETY